ncbi:zinc finger Ran-binding domain-containing protein 2-like [Ruditapes philippinarum]|uniref:zinc finger Ran-binding domain-containing protein 2-like n=1 Tax=Ruditapes philippinarum TaxID=129788 RepID=UPI00295C1C34|nr:zinc finger Ran-binding domain-containing protein 2-like [Ruditapes philippinarum]
MKEMRSPENKWESFELNKVKFQSDNRQECEEYNQTTTAELSEEEEEGKELGKRKPKKRIMEDFISEIDETRTRTEQTVIQKSPLSCSSAKLTQDKEKEKSSNKAQEKNKAVNLPKPPTAMISRTPLAKNKDSGESRGKVCNMPSRHSRSPSYSPLHGSVRSWRPRSRNTSPSQPSRHGSDRSWRSRSRSRSQSFRDHTWRMSSTPRQYSRSRSRSPYFSQRYINRSRSKSPFRQEIETFHFQCLHLKLSLSKIGGVTAVDHTRKAMERMLHNSLMAKMNMKGKKGKFPFGKTQLFQAIIETVRDSHSNVTEVTIKDAIMKQLKYAPERAGGGGKKMPANEIKKYRIKTEKI